MIWRKLFNRSHHKEISLTQQYLRGISEFYRNTEDYSQDISSYIEIKYSRAFPQHTILARIFASCVSWHYITVKLKTTLQKSITLCKSRKGKSHTINLDGLFVKLWISKFHSRLHGSLFKSWKYIMFANTSRKTNNFPSEILNSMYHNNQHHTCFPNLPHY